MDKILDVNDLTRLYQLYIMTDKILSNQMKTKSGLNYESLKLFRSMSIRINYLHMHNALDKLSKLDYDAKDIYDEQKKLNKKVEIMEDVNDARNILINKYRKYSALPLVLEDLINLDTLDYYRDKLKHINEYLKNENYLDKLDNTLNTLGIDLGNKTRQMEEILSLISIYEKELCGLVLDDNTVLDSLMRNGFDVRELYSNNSRFNSLYEKKCIDFDEIKEKYEAMALIDKNEYGDVISEITNEYYLAKKNKFIVEILKLLFTNEKEYDRFYDKRINIKTYLLDLKENIFGRKFENLLNQQIEKCYKYNNFSNEIDFIKEEINKNNLLLSRIKKEQDKLLKIIFKKNNDGLDDILSNQVVSIEDAYIPYSKERVNRVLGFVWDKLNKQDNNQELNSQDLFVDERKEDGIFEEKPSVIDNNLDRDLFVVSDVPFNHIEDKVESYDDIFHDMSKNDDMFVSQDADINNRSDEELYDLTSNIFNDKINPNIQFMNNGNFWPNIG